MAQVAQISGCTDTFGRVEYICFNSIDTINRTLPVNIWDIFST